LGRLVVSIDEHEVQRISVPPVRAAATPSKQKTECFSLERPRLAASSSAATPRYGVVSTSAREGLA
jgi:hypothetical protein